jgi:hypothetical protein
MPELDWLSTRRLEGTDERYPRDGCPAVSLDVSRGYVSSVPLSHGTDSSTPSEVSERRPGMKAGADPRLLWTPRSRWFGSLHFMEATPGCTQEKIKSVNSGNTLASNPSTGPAPKPTNLSQNSLPSSPGFVPVRLLNVASRCI